MNPKLLKAPVRLIDSLRSVHPLAAAGLKDRATTVDHPGGKRSVQLLKIPVKYPIIAIIDAENPASMLDSCSYNGPNSRVHPGSISPGGQNADSLHSV